MKKSIRIGMTLGFLAVGAHAADGTWTGVADGEWGATANWSGGVVASGAGSSAYFTNLAGPIRVTNNVADLRLKGLLFYGGAYSLHGQPLTFEGATWNTLGVTGGTHSVESPVNMNGNLQVAVEAGARLTTSGLLDNLGTFSIQKRGGGEWVFSGTSYETNAANFFDIEGGVFRVASGAVLTKRGGNREQFRVGYSGRAGRVVIESGAALNLAGFVLGHDTAAATGHLLVDGGTLTANMTGTSNPLLVGRWATGTLCASNSATIDVTDWFNLGVFMRGELHIGGNSTMTAGRFALGWHTQEASNFNGPGVATVGSGTLSVLNQFVWRSSGVASRTNLMTVGNGTPGSATLRLPATMRTASTLGSARLTLDGGTLEMIGARNISFGESLTNYLFGLEQLWVGRAGAGFDTGTNVVEITQTVTRDPSVTRDGGIVKTGAGMLTLAGGCAYNGPTVIQQGALRALGALPTGAVSVSPGATLSLADGQFRTFAPSALTAGQAGESVIELEIGTDGASDTLALASGAQLGAVLFRTVPSAWPGVPYVLPGDYVVATYTGAAPEVGGWRMDVPAGVSATFEVQPAQKRVVLHIAGEATDRSVWIYPGGGAWQTAENWSVAPVSGPSASVLFGGVNGQPSAVNLASAFTLGTLTFDSPFAYTLGGAGLTIGESGTGGTLETLRGTHAIDSALTLPEELAVVAQPGAALTLGGGVSGSGRVVVTGGGTLSVANPAAFGVPLTLNGAILAAPDTAELSAALTAGAGGATLAPAAGKTLTLSGAVDGPGALVKSGASTAALTGANTGSGALTVQNGTLRVAALTSGGELVIGEGRLTYTGGNVTTDKGLTIRTSDATLGATFDTDADVTFNGNIKAERGVFIKAGSGTVTLAAPGVNNLGTGEGSGNYSAVMNFGANGESPTQGLRIFHVINGKVVMGLPGQTNMMNQTVIIGGQSTAAAGAETAGHLEINGGYVKAGFLTVGRGNGTPVTAPVPLESSLTINDGYVESSGLWMAANLNDMTTYRVNARPRFYMNGGVLTGSQLFCGNNTCSIYPKLYFNGGFATFTGGGAEDVRLAYAGGVTSETFVAGGTLAISNAIIRLADNAATARGILRLNAGRLITRGIDRVGSGVAELYLNGGILQPSRTMALSNVLTVAAVQAGGLVTEVPDGLTLTVLQTLSHDAALGDTPDGGVVKLGPGTLVLAGTQGYTGPTVVSGGVLRVTGTLAVTNLTLASGATLSLTNGAHQVFAVTGLTAGGGRIELDIASDGSAHDVLALPGGVAGSLVFRLVKTGTGDRFVRPGRYPLVTFSGDAPDTGAWSVEELQGNAVFETEGATVYVRIGTGATASVWTNAAGGAWGEAGNWSAAPADDASANVFFGSAITAPATVTTGGGTTFGYMAVDSLNAYTWSGGALTLGSAESNVTVRVVRGAHVADTDLAVPSVAAVVVDAGATLTVNRAVTGAGSLAVTGGGTLALTNGPAVDVLVAMDGARLAMPQSTVFDTPFTLGAAGAVFAPGTGKAVEVTSDITGSGSLTKAGSSLLTLSGGTDFGGELVVRNGTVSMAAEPDAALVLGEGTFRYTGVGAAFTRGYTVRTTASTQAATFDTDTDITFNGQARAERGTFIKLGAGTLTYAYPGLNTLSAGDFEANGGTYLDVQPYGDTPTQGYRSYNVFKGKVVLGAAGQTNVFSQALIVGGQSTTNAGAETAGHMEINGGVTVFADYITVGRGNGTDVTAPEGVASTFTVNGGEITASGVWMAAMLSNQSTLTARPRFTLNGGSLHTLNFYCGNVGGTPRPEIVVNGGTLTVGPNETLRLANSPGCETEMTINGGSVILTNQALSLADNHVGAKGTLNLNGGRLEAYNLYRNGPAGSGVVHFNGGVFAPSATRTLTSIALTNRAGGAVFDVPQGIVFTVQSAVEHDETLGATPDGGVVKLGAGTLVLTGANTYTGPTVASNGTLSVTGTLAGGSAVSVAPGGTLALAAPMGGAFAAGALTLGETAGDEAVLAVTANDAALVSGGAVAVAGDLFLGKTAVTLTVRETGVAPATNGTFVVFTCAGTISGDPADLRVANPVFGKGYAFSVAGGEVLVTVGAVTSGAAVWNSAGGGEWPEAGNWITAPGAGAAGLTVGFMDAIQSAATVTLDTAATVGTVLFRNANAYTLAGTGSLTLDETNGVPQIVAELGTQTVAVASVLADDVTVAVTNTAELRLSGAVGGNGRLTKIGNGRLVLSGGNTYAGGTAVASGPVDIAGTSPFGSGPVVVSGSPLTATGAGPVTVANAVTSTVSMTVTTEAPLTLSGGWTAAGGGLLLAKTGTNELAVAGAFKPAAGVQNRLEVRQGSVRFAAGADAVYTSTVARNSIDFGTAAAGATVRRVSIEPGASVSANCLYVGFGVTNIVSVSGGSLFLTGYSSDHRDAMVGVGANSGSVVTRYEVSGGSVYAADNAWWIMGAYGAVRSTLDVAGGTVSIGQFSLGNRDLTGTLGESPTDVTVRGGLLDVRQRWNWMGDANGARMNSVWLDGGRLRLPATYVSNSNKISVSRLTFNGGVLETPGGGTAAENPANYLDGLKLAYVGAGGAVIDTLGRNVTLGQRLVKADGAADGGLVKRGQGTLTLAKPPVCEGVLDVWSGTLRLAPEAAPVLHPEDPMLRLTFENGVQADDSPYGQSVATFKGNTNNLNLVAGKNGNQALAFNSQNALYLNLTPDMTNMSSYTVSTWVYKSTFSGTNPSLTFFGTLDDYVATAHEFLLRTTSGGFRMLATGADNKGFGQRIVEVTNAVPLNTWTMLTLVVNGTDGISMYVNGQKRMMRSTETGEGGPWTLSEDYGVGARWFMTRRTSGRLCAIGTTTTSDVDYFNGVLDDMTIYNRALSSTEIGLLYQAANPYGCRARVAAGATLDLSGAAQALAELTGEGFVGNGTAAVTGTLNPGDSAASAAGALLTAANLTLGTNMTYRCDWTPEANDLVDVWGTLTVNGAGMIDLGLTDPGQMPGAPRVKSFPVMVYTDIVGAANFAQWRVTGTGKTAAATVMAANGVVTVTLDVPSGTLIRLR